MNRPAASLALALVMAGHAAGCAKNPVTGHRQMMLITEEQEFAIGQGADAEIRRQEGVYLELPALRSYVDRVGNELAAHGERPGMVFHFEVLDSQEINAFALPGGFVYVTRGILERLSSEDELAVVVGHEIAHVTARHGAARISKLYALQYGSLLGAIISPRTMVNYGDLIDLALNVALSAYSREQESEADLLGLRYAASLGYRPREAITVMKLLQWMERKEPGALEKWFLSHPPASQRIADIEAAIASPAIVAAAPGTLPTRREPYLRQIDGLLVGQDNGSELVVRDRYINREVKVSLRVPPGWEVALDPQGALVTMRHEEREFLTLDAAPMNYAADAASVETEFEKSLRRRGWKRTGGEAARTNQGDEARIARYEGMTAKGEPVGILCLFVAREKRRFILTRLADASTFDEEKDRYRAEALEIQFLSEPDLASIGPPRLRLVVAPAGSTWASLANEHLGGEQEAERLAFYNGRPGEEPPETGLLVKIPPTLSLHP